MGGGKTVHRTNRARRIPAGTHHSGGKPKGLSETEREHLRCILQQYEEDPRVLEMDQYIQHGCVTTYQHCRNVARVSFWINRRFHVGADETALAVGALLHDFYLYDWHCAGRFQHCRGLRTLFKMHGFIHPLLARENAERCFALSPKVGNIIRSHMWPLTLFHAPSSREAVIVCIADKYCAVLEAVYRNRQKAVCA